MTEETMGRRIAGCRKRLGLTQDALAESLGVTAQAVSKWENDQSCPDISMLPKLSDIFEITTDELLGVKPRQEPESSVAPAPTPEKGKWKGSRVGVAVAIWLLLNSTILLANEIQFFTALNPWTLLLPTGLLVFGALGLLRRFSFFLLGCVLFGGYYTYIILNRPPQFLNESMLLLLLVVIFSLELLWKSMQGRHIFGAMPGESRMDLEGAGFMCTTSFGDVHRRIHLPRLEKGQAKVSFGSMTLDLRECGEIADGCHLLLEVSFGNIILLMPDTVQIVIKKRTAFGTVQEYGRPAENAQMVICLDCSVQFGDIEIRY